MEFKNVEWFKERIREYPESDQHNPDLLEFLEEIKKLNRDSRKEIVSQLRFEPMFDLVIKWNNPVYADPFYELAQMVFEVMKAPEVVTTYEPYLLKFIDHVSGRFQDLVFSVLERVVLEDELETLSMHQNLLLAAARVLADRSLDTATPCLKFLTTLANKKPQGTLMVFTGEIGKVIKDYAGLDQTLHFRIYEIVTGVACSSPEGLALMQQTRMLQDLHDSMLGPEAHVDQLGFANTVEAYKRLSHAPHCYDFLVQSGVMAKLEERVVEYGPGTMEDKVMPTLYEFFGELCATDPENVFRDAPAAIPTVMRLVMVPIDRVHVTRAAMITIGQVATLPAGKRFLRDHAELMNPILALAGDFVRSGAADNKTTAIDFTEALIFLKKKDQTEDLLATTEAWFKASMRTVKFVWDFAIEPYPAIARTAIQVFVQETIRCRLAALRLMAVLSTLPWGRRLISDTPGLLEWLVDRYAACGVHARSGAGGDPEVLRAKFAVVSNLLDHPDSSSYLSSEARVKLMEYKVEGPLYVKGEYEVAMESAE